jgi:hypothetical protein
VTVYTSTARVLIDQVQATIDEHTISGADGRCVACHVSGPRLPRRDALYVLAAWHQLPQRHPGATGPDLGGARA